MSQQGTKVFVISLARSTERRATFASRAQGADIPWAFFDGWTSLAPQLNYDPGEALRSFGRVLTETELACYSSHFMLWSALLEDTAEQYIILEDDVIADWTMIGRLASLDFHAANVDFLRLYYKRPRRASLLKLHYPAQGTHLVQLVRGCGGAQGYVLTRAGAERFVQFARDVVRPIDNQTDRFWEHGIPNLSLFPFPIVEALGQSTIGGERYKMPLPGMAARLRGKLQATLEAARRRAWFLRYGLHRVGRPENFRTSPALSACPAPDAGAANV